MQQSRGLRGPEGREMGRESGETLGRAGLGRREGLGSSAGGGGGGGGRV